jgi:hypothetical protein
MRCLRAPGSTPTRSAVLPESHGRTWSFAQLHLQPHTPTHSATRSPPVRRRPRLDPALDLDLLLLVIFLPPTSSMLPLGKRQLATVAALRLSVCSATIFNTIWSRTNASSKPERRQIKQKQPPAVVAGVKKDARMPTSRSSKQEKKDFPCHRRITKGGCSRGDVQLAEQ